MDLHVNDAKVNASMMQSSKEVKEEKQQKTEERPQIKEHCSSKAGKALRSMAIGLALAAGVAVSAKGMPVYAQGKPESDNLNTTSISEEQQSSTQKTDVEMMVDELIEESQGQTTTLHVGDKNTCHGKMAASSLFGGRDYDSSKITEDGNLVFYKKVRNALSYEYEQVNSFDLKASSNGNSIDLQTGSRYEENSNLHGDYVELAEDGRTFNVYNKDGDKIGHVKANTKNSYNIKVAASAVGAITFVGEQIAIRCKKD